ncbi:DUF3131 domain-containing protein [Thalassotalea euphylliae]|uniref:DUF3131 domain-containing protein n=1 Tax=Thalassotalea euphylliae TaxID=1655234 RepID=A0A3E0TLE5_9GAMM|nr:DUF3131 domain-containing protein [Thalassotalea euphylliae]REL25338.1 DUF3131 domain-containing protein [Thalassotalea euphylliae]
MLARKALVLLLVLKLSACGVVVRTIDSGITSFAHSGLFHQGQHGELTEKEQVWAKIAWTYFKNNSHVETGLANSIDGYPSATMSSIADYLAALVAARQLALIDKKEFDHRLSALLHFLNRMPLFRGRLPNKIYDTKNGKMLDYEGKNQEIGWSAIDIGRLLIWLRIVSQQYPEFHEYIDKAIFRWNFCDVIDQEGSLYTGSLVNNQISLRQEGRLGYEEYAAMGFRAWGFEPTKAESLDPLEVITIYGQDIYHDARDHRDDKVLSPILTLPFSYMGIEFNWDRVDDDRSLNSRHTNSLLYQAAKQVYQVQELRYVHEKIYTARTEHILDSAPYFLYDSVFANGYAWNTISDTGKTYPGKSLVSVKAAFSMHMLWDTDYTYKLMLVIEELYDAKRGWYEGRYESTGGYEEAISSSTNATVLEALLYKKVGKLFRPNREVTHSDIRMENVFKHPGKCFPALYRKKAQLTAKRLKSKGNSLN